MFKRKKFFITGGCGFIGSHLVESLVEKGAQVIVYDNLSSGFLENLATVRRKIKFVQGDILEYRRLKRAMKGAEIVSHQAAQLEILRCRERPLEDLRINTEGTINVLRACIENKVQYCINASSACVYGQAEEVPEDEEKHRTNPNWAYGVSKLAAEKYAQIYSKDFGLPIASLRYSIVYGPREWYGRVLTIFLKRALQGKPLVIFGKGQEVRDFLFVQDLVRMHNLCIQKRVEGIYNVSTAQGTTIEDLAKCIREIVGRHLEIIYEEVPEGGTSYLVKGRVRLPAELKVMLLDNKKAKRVLGWQPEVSLREGLIEEVRWLNQNLKRWHTIHI